MGGLSRPKRATAETKPAKKRRRGGLIAAVVLVWIVAGGLGAVVVTGWRPPGPDAMLTYRMPVAWIQSEEASKESPPVTITFAAVGDNLIHNSIYWDYDLGNGTYDFTPAYAAVAPYIQEVDWAFINQETLAAGTALGLSSYPTFNGPAELIDAVAATGFDWVNTASNHSFDRAEDGVLAQLDVLDRFPQLVQTGMNRSWADAETPTVVQIDGVLVGLASYTYGLNGFTLPYGEEYLVNLIDWDRIGRDMAVLTQVSDVQIVSMHWGTEYNMGVDAYQEELAQYLADLGVDVIVGTHPHVVEPVRWVTGSSGNRTLVMYSLGNFISAQDEPERMLGAMVRWSVTYNPADNSIAVGDVEIWPTATHITPGFAHHETWLLRDYTPELAAQHMLAYRGLTPDYLRALAGEVFGSEFPLVM